MSPTAVGKPHTRTFSIDSGATVNMPSSPANFNGLEGTRSPKRIIPHLEDLVVARPDVDVKSPLRTILEKGDLLARQADTHLDFRRPDLALQEYVSASVIAVDIIPRHPDYLALQKDRGELYRLYMGLNKRINLQHKKFAEVKELIKEDNARTGVQPSPRAHTARPDIMPRNANGDHWEVKSNDIEKTNGHNGSVSAKKRPAPAIQPKPDALHGKAIPPSGVSDLASRFARLQNGGPVQDPRINTRPIELPDAKASRTAPSSTPYGSGHTMNRPVGPREIPPSSIAKQRLTNPPLDVVLSGMPRAPDAIHHSPLRTAGTPDLDTANLPSSVSRNSSFLGQGRKDSAPPISTVGPSPYVGNERLDYFTSPTRSSHDNTVPAKPERKILPSPDSTTITPEDLVGYLRRGQQSLKVLIVDLRNRQEFDSGHILSQSTICVEPITLRHGISGEQLADSMVIAPTSEQDLFERRHEFDLLVFYDQSSSSIETSGIGKSNDSILRDFASAVFEFGYDKCLKQRPLLLAGGLDAWVDLLGPNSLQASATGGGHTNTPRNKVTALAVSRREALLAAKRKARSSRVGTKTEEDEWDSVMKTDGDAMKAAEELSYARTQDEFLRRFPEVSLQESMISTSPASFQHEVENSMPRPPARPAPALPRQRSSGITEKGVSLRFAQPAGPGTGLVTQPGVTGLKNLGNSCYMNAAFQLLSNTRVVRNMLMNFQPGTLPVPPAPNEKIKTPPLQLMTRAAGNLFTHMWSGNYLSLSPKTITSYINAVDSASTASTDRTSRARCFGGAIQHDSGEFSSWLIDVLMDEVNPRRGLAPRNPPADESLEHGRLEAGVAAKTYWDLALLNNNSAIIKEMGVLEVVTRTCGTNGCNTRRRDFRLGTFLTLLVTPTPQQTATLASLFERAFGFSAAPQMIPEVRCDVCNLATTHISRDRLGRMPNTLWVLLNRGNGQEGAYNQKVTTRITFKDRIDLSPYFDGAGLTDAVEPEFRPSFMYDVVSVTMHLGQNIASGHYINYSRIPNAQGGGESWHKFDDSVTSPSSFEATQGNTSEQATFLCLQKVT